VPARIPVVARGAGSRQRSVPSEENQTFGTAANTAAHRPSRIAIVSNCQCTHHQDVMWTAKMLGLEIPPGLSAIADEVIA
jgi:hypothetical protein